MSFFGPSIPPGVSGLDKGAARAAQDAARRKKQGVGKVAGPGTSGGDEVDLNVEGLSAAQAVRRAAGNAQEETAQDRREHPGYQAAKSGAKQQPPPSPPRPSLDVNG